MLKDYMLCGLTILCIYSIIQFVLLLAFWNKEVETDIYIDKGDTTRIYYLVLGVNLYTLITIICFIICVSNKGELYFENTYINPNKYIIECYLFMFSMTFLFSIVLFVNMCKYFTCFESKTPLYLNIIIFSMVYLIILVSTFIVLCYRSCSSSNKHNQTIITDIITEPISTTNSSNSPQLSPKLLIHGDIGAGLCPPTATQNENLKFYQY